MRSTELRCKIKSLAAEQRIIRAEELKLTLKHAPLKRKPRILGLDSTRASLHEHRVLNVRRELRAAYLALAFLRNRDRIMVERSWRSEPDWRRVVRIAYKFGPRRSLSHKESLVAALCKWAGLDISMQTALLGSLRYV